MDLPGKKDEPPRVFFECLLCWSVFSSFHGNYAWFPLLKNTVNTGIWTHFDIVIIGSWSRKTVESRPSFCGSFTWGTFGQASQTWQLRSAYAEHWGQEPEAWDIKKTNQNVVLQKGWG